MKRNYTAKYTGTNKLCLIGARRAGVLWIQGNTWNMEGENWAEWC